MIWSGTASLRVQTLARRRGPAHGVRTADASHGDDSAATRADADDSRGAASASGAADVGPRGNGGRPRLTASGSEETARVARADRSTVRRACPRARGASWLRCGGARLASVASARVRQGVEASVDHRRRDDPPPLRAVRLARDRRAAVHTGVDDGRGMEAGSAHAVDADRRCRGVSQRVVVAQRHDCAGREDSDR